MPEKKELIPRFTTPLQWAADWPQTRVQDRIDRKAWNKPAKQYVTALVRELSLMGATSVSISSNLQVGGDGEWLPSQPTPRNPSVTVYFTKPEVEDFTWQDVLRLTDPDVKPEDVENAYRELSKKFHPDNKLTGDHALFVALADAKRKALGWIRGDHLTAKSFALACDRYTEVKWNIKGVQVMVAALRAVERSGASQLLDRTLKGFQQLAAGTGV